jgi:NTE family protein
LGVSLALQGAGAHGAFTWGVLDRLIEDGRFCFPHVTGVSSGAVNAAVTVSALQIADPSTAREHLRLLWHRVAECAPQPTLMDHFTGQRFLHSFPAMFGLDALIRGMTPSWYGLNDYSPLLPIIDDLVQTDALNGTGLVIGAADAITGELALFQDETLTRDSLLASACVPFLSPPVTINGRLYIDGVYAANPPLTPLFERPPGVLLLVRLVPNERSMPPVHPLSLFGRLTEFGMTGVLHRDVDHLRVLGWTVVEVHADETLADLPSSTKLTGGRFFLEDLHEQGRAAMAPLLDQLAAAAADRARADPPP